jgi:DNA replication and repair protein RecF
MIRADAGLSWPGISESGGVAAMYARHLSLSDYRSWPTAEVELRPGVNVLIGRNGTGKTNLVEALGYLATLSSHRVAGDAPLIRRGTERAIVRAAVVSDDRELLLEVEITAGRANRARINRAPLTRARDILGVLRTVLFAPEDLALVRGDPSERRKFLDDVLIMRAPRLAGVRADYDRVLKQRNALLKSAGPARRPGGDLSTLEVWDEHLATTGAELVHARLALVAEFRPHVAAAYADIAGSDDVVDLAYRSSIPLPGARNARAPDAVATDAGATEVEATEVEAGPASSDAVSGPDAAVPGQDELRAAMLTELLRVRRNELDRGISLIGPHRDDLELQLGGGPAKGYASHGESWSYALALKLGAFALLRSDGVDPVLVLDDVFAELDVTRRDRLAELIADADQVLITAAVQADVPSALGGVRLMVTADGIQPGE